MKSLLVILCCIVVLNVAGQKQVLPYLENVNGKTELIVNKEPFLMFSGELHNSSAGSAHYMRPIWKRMKENNLNTVIAPVCWELIEPVEGKFDFSLVDSMVIGAREQDLKLVILWFGSWKNGKSTYVPEWVKTNTDKYPLMVSKSRRTLNTLNTFGNNSLEADKKAFGKLMNHIKKIDSKEQTVVMVQVQNEVGILGSPRDYSEQATEAFNGPVPAELMTYLQNNKESLYPALLTAWKTNGFKTTGTWEEVFGKGEKYRGEEWKTNFGYYTEELFMAWNLAKYIGEVTQKGKDEYALPMFANAWIKQPRAVNPGKYPSGGPLPHVIDIWRAAAPAIDFIACDIYAVEEFDWVCEEFSRSENPVFIPETTPTVGGAARALYAFGKYDALCYAPFGIDGYGLFNTADVNDESLKKVYGCLNDIKKYINENRNTDNMTALYIGEGEKATDVDMGDYIVYMSRFSSAGLFKQTGGRFGIEGEEDRSPAGLIIIKLSNDEFIVAGGVGGIQISVGVSKSNKAVNAGYASVDEITFDDKGKMKLHRLNGDETALGGAIIRPGEVKAFKIKMYTY
ncbi:DUF5597 domain-containing protein [Plebeiibacterium marinum]|uniref:DUF5597 domain-containing protein n=1 Tax=Plebeiibacterium marinum TaxID=2992111 RepID=A0AAE3MGV8_9BACT|nr:DUF5597 domain-containing protein [Plebeiobacterium marinum]MCW3807344.1 DUF5597 domain-containing protein [Plebeiobacterium marinum]